jgi:hypothetical protein
MRDAANDERPTAHPADRSAGGPTDPSSAQLPPPGAPPGDTPHGVVRRFAARYGWTVEDLAETLRLDASALEADDRVGSPPWLRYALMGLAVRRGVPAAALSWLLEEYRADESGGP